LFDSIAYFLFRASSTKKNKYEIGAFEEVNDSDIPHLRSGKNSHLLFLYWGNESQENLEKALRKVLEDIHTIRANNNKVEIMEKGEKITVEVTIWLTCDMVCLCKVLGLGSVYNPQSKYCCPWCEITRVELGDFRKQSWTFRTIAVMKELGAKQAQKAKPSPGDAKGIIVWSSKIVEMFAYISIIGTPNMGS
jgi:hypothetical protein